MPEVRSANLLRASVRLETDHPLAIERGGAAEPGGMIHQIGEKDFMQFGGRAARAPADRERNRTVRESLSL